MILNYFQNKGFSGSISADIVNTWAVVVGLATIFEVNTPASYVTWWAFGYTGAVLTFLTAAYLWARFKEAGQPGIDVLFWVTLFVAICTFVSGFLSLLARLLVAGRSFLPYLPAFIFLLLIGALFYVSLITFLVHDGPILRALLMFILAAIALGVGMGVMGGLAGETTVPSGHGVKQASAALALLGLVFWQDAEMLNIFGNADNWQKAKSILQCLGALLLLVAGVVQMNPDAVLGLFIAGTALAGLGTLLGVIAGGIKYFRRLRAGG